MDAAPSVDLLRVAAACVKLVDTRFGRQLDWSVDSLRHLDDVCAELSADEPHEGERFDLWRRLIAAYTGQVVVEAYGGQWVAHDQVRGAYAVAVNGIFGFPFAVADRVLSREPYKTLEGFARTLPAIAER